MTKKNEGRKTAGAQPILEGLPKSRRNKIYFRELKRLQSELVKLHRWIRHKGLRVIILFEGRDAAGKGGTIKRITEPLNPRYCRIAALDKPNERERTQWYFQRYVAHFPAAGELVLFDRSWYNRAGVEHVMGFCSEEEYEEFLLTCPVFEEMIQRSGIILLKYWFSVSLEEQENRFVKRMKDQRRRWKLSPMDLESRNRWIQYSEAKDTMFERTDTDTSPWYVVESDNKMQARLNCIHHILHQIPYEEIALEEIELPPRPDERGYKRRPISKSKFVPDIY